MVVGVLGTLFVTETIQDSLEPHLAPTPKHRLTRLELQNLVSIINADLYREMCDALTTPPARPLVPKVP